MSTRLDDLLSFVNDPALGLYLLKLPILGNLDSYDSYNRSTAVTGDPYLKAGSHGYGMNNGSASTITVADAAEQRGTDGTIFLGTELFINLPTSADVVRLVSKRDGGDVMWDMFYQSDLLKLYDGTTRTISAIPSGKHRTISVVHQHTVKAQFYLDGVWESEATAVSDITAASVQINIGHIFSSSLQTQNTNFQMVALFSAKLTSQQNADLHYLFDRLHVATQEPQLTKARNHQVVDQLLRLDGRTRQGKVTDLSGHGIDFTPTVGVTWENNTPSGGRAFGGTNEVRDAANLSVTDTQLDNLSPSTYSFWLKLNSYVSGQRIYEKAAGKLAIWVSTNQLYLYESWNSGTSIWFAATSTLPLDKWTHCSVRFGNAAGSVPQVFINGVEAAITTSVASTGTRDSDVGAAFILERSAGSRELDGALDDFQIFDRYLTDVEAKSLYLRSGLRSLDLGYNHTYPQTLEDRTEGNVGPWSIISGTHSWTADNKLETTGTGVIATYSQQAYGAWYWKTTNVHAASNTRILFVASLHGDEGDSNQDGYVVNMAADESIKLERYDNGSDTELFSTAPSAFVVGTEYEFFVSRLDSGVFKLWIRGGTYTTWTLLTTQTDATYSASSAIVARLATGDKWCCLNRFPYGFGLVPNDVPWLED